MNLQEINECVTPMSNNNRAIWSTTWITPSMIEASWWSCCAMTRYTLLGTHRLLGYCWEGWAYYFAWDYWGQPSFIPPLFRCTQFLMKWLTRLHARKAPVTRGHGLFPWGNMHLVQLIYGRWLCWPPYSILRRWLLWFHLLTHPWLYDGAPNRWLYP